jgi:hypothetical protein
MGTRPLSTGRPARGEPRYDNDGRPREAYGPQDHMALEDMQKLQALVKALRAAEILRGVSPFF